MLLWYFFQCRFSKNVEYKNTPNQIIYLYRLTFSASIHLRMLLVDGQFFEIPWLFEEYVMNRFLVVVLLRHIAVGFKHSACQAQNTSASLYPPCSPGRNSSF